MKVFLKINYNNQIMNEIENKYFLIFFEKIVLLAVFREFGFLLHRLPISLLPPKPPFRGVKNPNEI